MDELEQESASFDAVYISEMLRYMQENQIPMHLRPHYEQLFASSYSKNKQIFNLTQQNDLQNSNHPEGISTNKRPTTMEGTSGRTQRASFFQTPNNTSQAI